MELSAEQLAAVERSGQDVCVVAGPGSGKTRVLVERFAWLVERKAADPARILAITFTEKAATMMKRKLVERFAQRQDVRERVERAWVATIDAFCARLLRENAIEAGLAPDFSVLDEGSAKRMRREAAEQALDELFRERPEALRRLLEGVALSTGDDARQVDLAASLLDVHESMRLAGVRALPAVAGSGEDALPEARRLAEEVSREAAWSNLHDWVRAFLALAADPVTRQHFEVLARFKPNLRGKKKGLESVRALKDVALPRLAEQWILAWHSGLPELLREAVARLDSEYREAKRREAAVDFADLEELAIELLEAHPELRGRIVNQFDHVLMDELQDTNRLQWKLLGLVRRQNFFAVGDINQSIYGFRHADRTVFEGYRAELRDKGLPIDELKENYRSRPEILATVTQVLEGRDGVEARELIAKRAAADTPVVERLVGTGERAAEAEAQLVAARITEWARDGRRWGDFAILVRALHSAEPFERDLEARGIPFLVSGGRTFLEARETLDVMALLAAMVNPLDEIATAGVLRGPLVGWSDERLLRLGQEGRRQEFEKLFGRARKLAGFIAPDRLLAMALDECGYAAGLNDRGRANVDKLLGWIRREGRSRSMLGLGPGLGPLAELLEDLEAMRAARVEAEAPAQQAADAVNIMTIHAAKGLEFPVVFVSALQGGRKNSTPVLLFSAELGLGVKWRNPATGESEKDAAHSALSKRRKKDEDAEEDRLLYVAMTRAEERLVLSYARGKKRSQWQKDAEKGIGAETAADWATEIHAGGPRRVETAAPATPEIVLEAAVVTGQHDSSAAVTDVAQFAACPRKYYLARYLGLTPEPRGPGTWEIAGRRPAQPAIELGLQAHKALAGQPAESGEAKELARRFEESELGQRAARAKRVEREFDFLLAVEDVVLRGQIDLWFEEGGELTLVDYKTDRDETGAAEYALQLRLYALALEGYAGRLPDRAALCFLRSGKVREVSLSGADLEDARGAVRALAAAQNALEFRMKPGEQCRRCSFYEGLCPAKLED